MMSAMRALCAVAALLAACSAPSTVLVTIEDPAGSGGPLTLSLFAPRGALVAGRALPGPGRVVLQNVPAPEMLRVVVASTTDLRAGASRVASAAGEQVSVRLVLGNVSDGDGDRIPDTVDVCPSVADPDQADDDADGVGNACVGGGGEDLAVPNDLGVVDVGVVDASRDLAPPSDLAAAPCPAGATLCESFESGAINTARWPSKFEQPPATTVSVSSLRAHTGLYAMRAHFAANGGSARFLDAQLVNFNAFPADPAFVRAWVYFDGPPPFTGSVTFANIQQNVPPYGGFTFYQVGAYVGVNSYNFPFSVNKNAVDPDGVVNPYNRWICYEWQVSNAGGGVLKTFVDGVARTTADATFATQSAGIGELILGAEGTVAANAPAFDIYIDDVAVSTSRIGCN